MCSFFKYYLECGVVWQQGTHKRIHPPLCQGVTRGVATPLFRTLTSLTVVPDPLVPFRMNAPDPIDNVMIPLDEAGVPLPM